ncbi:hypothetical protein GCM10027590_32280 [Nocardiopsis nanhaiensis]
MLLAKARIGPTLVTFRRNTEGEYTVVAVTGNRFGFSRFAPDDEATARECYANTVRSVCKETAGY